MSGCGARRTGFTLIELLVVVAIIALLISILLPSLSKARKQARTTVCASRIAQMTKAIFLYLEDFDETPPFIGTGYESINAINYKSYWGQPAEHWARLEDWLVPNMPDIWLSPQSDWPEHVTVQNGRLFSYTRFEDVYRCPEFERSGPGRKSQEVFNYTRGITCRKALSAAFPGDGTDEPLTCGPILKPSNIYSTSDMWMMFDEQWDYHCAIPEDQLDGTGGQDNAIGTHLVNFWMGIECIQCICGDGLGSYHGTLDKTLKFEAIAANEMGNLSYYDGHVALYRDPVPYRHVDPAAPDFWQVLVPGGVELSNLIIRQIFAQRGKSVDPDDLADIFMP